jgi:hypothetical protein
MGGLLSALLGAALLGCSQSRTPTAAVANGAAAPAAANSAASATGSAGAAPATGNPPAAGAQQPDIILLAGTAFAACMVPAAPPDPPDGKVATTAQMLVSNRQTSSYNAATNAYLACLDAAQSEFERQYGRVLGQGGLDDIAAIHTRMHNQAVDADHAVADKFNQQLRLFKTRSGST